MEMRSPGAATNDPKSTDGNRTATEMRRIHVEDHGVYPCGALPSIRLLGVVMAEAQEAAKGRRGLRSGHESGQVDGEGGSALR